MSDTDFPSGQSAADRLRFLLNYAVLAPSRYNAQPWLFKITGNDLRLYADRTRALPASDPNDRALIMGCGAALYFLRVAVRHFGHTARIHTFPDLNDEDLLAVVRLGPPKDSTPDFDRLFAGITGSAAPDTEMESPSMLPTQLDPEIGRYGVELHQITRQADLDTLHHIISQSLIDLERDRRMMQERELWISQIDPLVNGQVGEVLAGETVYGRTVGQGAAPAESEAAPSAAHNGQPGPLLVVCTPGDNTASWLAAGQALAQTVLRTRRTGATLVPMYAPIEFSDSREAIARLLSCSGHPQVVLRLEPRISRAAGVSRRPVHDVLLTQRQH